MSKGSTNKAARREQIVMSVMQRVTGVAVIQERPWTAVQMNVSMPDGRLEVAYGFSKVRWPDEWDAKKGEELAVRKAIARFYKRFGKEIGDTNEAQNPQLEPAT